MDDSIDAELERLLAAPASSSSLTYDMRDITMYTPSNVMDLHLLSPAEITSQLRDMRRSTEVRRKKASACSVSIDELPAALVRDMHTAPPKGRVFPSKQGWRAEASSLALGKSVVLGTFDDKRVANLAYNLSQCKEHLGIASVHGGVQRFIVELARQHSLSADA